ncbi:hypothetical protein RF11_07703 [Thelohanellus kitauei]|uniref:Uncharacterized protein n=1 Tax=Thelohanellus kitauei TaxID=669202 RepID=A0A0C2MST1_THEKT|nr:hypothetical protein RF11_07703 [Thelohanellus kitauei]
MIATTVTDNMLDVNTFSENIFLCHFNVSKRFDVQIQASNSYLVKNGNIKIPNLFFNITDRDTTGNFDFNSAKYNFYRINLFYNKDNETSPKLKVFKKPGFILNPDNQPESKLKIQNLSTTCKVIYAGETSTPVSPKVINPSITTSPIYEDKIFPNFDTTVSSPQAINRKFSDLDTTVLSAKLKLTETMKPYTTISSTKDPITQYLQTDTPQFTVVLNTEDLKSREATSSTQAFDTQDHKSDTNITSTQLLRTVVPRHDNTSLTQVASAKKLNSMRKAMVIGLSLCGCIFTIIAIFSLKHVIKYLKLKRRGPNTQEIQRPRMYMLVA